MKQHRLNRGGDRHANAALHRIMIALFACALVMLTE
jgi:hypothetical protein